MTWTARLSVGAAAFLSVTWGLSAIGQRAADRSLGRNSPPATEEWGGTGELRLAVLGSSLSAATPWLSVGRRLSGCLGRPVRTDLVTGTGRTSVWGAMQTDRVVASNPHLLLVEFTINDADWRRGVLPSVSVEAHQRIIHDAKQAVPGVRIAFLRLNRAYGLRAFLRPALALYERRVARAFAELGGGLIDLREVWSRNALGVGRTNALPDGLHPSAEAAERITVPAMVSALAELITPNQHTVPAACAVSAQ